MPSFYDRDHRIFYEEIGSGPPLLLLHGNTASSRMFSQIAAHYAQEYRVVLPDYLGCGRSDRVPIWPEDLWYDEAMQVARLLDEKGIQKARVIGTSGGALAALNLALERPDLVDSLIADSFEGERALPGVTETLWAGREASKRDPDARAFYEWMNGADWEQVVDADTRAVLAHAAHIGDFFHRPLSALAPEVLLTGSREDAFCPAGFFEHLFPTLLGKIGHGQMCLFDHGAHPAMLSNQEAFLAVSRAFFAGLQ